MALSKVGLTLGYAVEKLLCFHYFKIIFSVVAGDGSHEAEFDMSAGPSNPEDGTTDQVPQGKSNQFNITTPHKHVR